jgi:hypothetical protein
LSNVLILGAGGGIALVSIDLFLKETDAQLKLYLRNLSRLIHLESNRVRVSKAMLWILKNYKRR